MATIILASGLLPFAPALAAPIRKTFFSKPIYTRPGQVFRDNVDLDFPPGNIGITAFGADLVFHGGPYDGSPVPLSHTYLHHWTVEQKYHHNAGFCGYSEPAEVTLGYLFGVGSESRHTSPALPAPYALMIDDTDKDTWFVDLHAIDLRNTTNPLGCRECLCTELHPNGHPRNLSQVVGNKDDYIGGLSCCEGGDRCRYEVDGPAMGYKLRYNITWLEGEDLKTAKPVYVFVMDVTGDFAVKSESRCQIEYNVPRVDSKYYYRNSTFQFPSDGTVLLTIPHLHSGGNWATVTRKATGERVCFGGALYGNGTEAGNEKGFVVGIEQCTTPFDVKAHEEFELRVQYSPVGGLALNQTSHVGVMGYVWMAIAKATER